MLNVVGWASASCWLTLMVASLAGFYRFPGHEGRGLASREVQGLLGLEKESPEWRSMAYLRREPEDVKRAKEAGWDAHMSTFKTFKGPGVLDTTAGFTVAHKACNFASQLAKEAGVQFVFGQAGDVTGFLRSGKKVCGVQTADGKCHRADVVIVCAGPWSEFELPATLYCKRLMYSSARPGSRNLEDH